MPTRTLTLPDGTTCDLDLAHDLAENGGVETEEIVLDWLDTRREEGLTADDLATRSGLTQAEAHARLVNLWENAIVLTEDDGVNVGFKNHGGRFFSDSAS